jgi:hypothetical protein
LNAAGLVFNGIPGSENDINHLKIRLCGRIDWKNTDNAQFYMFIAILAY